MSATTTTKRTDIHRPSAIEPSDYYFVALGYQRCDGLEDVYAIAENQRRLRDHMSRTGAKFSQHEHGGNCHICGAHCLYTVIFHHVPTNTLILTGMDCAEKMDMGDERMFRTFCDECRAAEHHRAGKLKAKAILDDKGLSRAWEISQLTEDPTDEPLWKCRDCGGNGCDGCDYAGVTTNHFHVLKSMVGSLIKYGDLTDKQLKFMAKAIDKVDNWDRVKAEREVRREAERLAAQDCPAGRTVITGEVLSTRTQDSQWGTTYKMLVKDDRGFKIWSSIPSVLQLIEVENKDDETGETWTHQRALGKGDRVTFTATIEPSKDDGKFGFAKRPSKAAMAKK